MIPFFHIDLAEIVRIIGYPGIFIAIYAETGLFFGFFLPGASMLFVAGFLASQGIFNIWILTGLIIVAAASGDSTGYWFGSLVGHKFFSRPDSRWFKREYVERTRAFYEKYGSQTIFIARFVPIVRTFAPILAGVAQMRYRTFLFYNVFGALAWGAGVTLAGYYLGSRIPHVDRYLGVVIVGIVVVTLLPLVFEWWKQHRNKKI